jgi:protein phosphatase PTC7
LELIICYLSYYSSSPYTSPSSLFSLSFFYVYYAWGMSRWCITRRALTNMASTGSWDKLGQAAPVHQAAWKAVRRTFHAAAQSKSKSSNLSYRVAAAYSAKGDKLDPDRNQFHLDKPSNQKRVTDDKQNSTQQVYQRPRSGQDAFFASNVGRTGAVAIGVADGVGGWTDQGINPADFSHALCEQMESFAQSQTSDQNGGPLKPSALMDHAFRRVINDPAVYGGGSTACVAIADPSGRLDVANLGDSGFVHIGINAVKHHSTPQTHGFNTPFQLTKFPKRMLVQMALFNGYIKQYAENPRDANITRHQLKNGDVLVFATDGVWDNLTPQDTLRVVSREMSSFGGWTDSDNGSKVGSKLWDLTHEGKIGVAEGRTLQAVLAQAIVAEAKSASVNTQRDGPFAKAVQKRYPGENWRGGKMDDICVVVVIAVTAEP